MIIKNRLAKLASSCLVLTFCFSTVHAIPVDLELSLVIDVSGSVNTNEYNLQMEGYANAFRDTAVQQAIADGSGIAVDVVFFSNSASEWLNSWVQLTDSATANSFADLLDNFARPFRGGTSIQSGINAAVPLFSNNGFEGTRQVIDVSGDGNSNAAAVDAAVASALTQIDVINGIAIESQSVFDFYNDHVIGGSGSFALFASGFDTFGDAVKQKIRAEIIDSPPPPSDVPEPATMALFAIGLIGVGASCRKTYRSQ